MTRNCGTRTMKAIARDAYGISALALEHVPVPAFEGMGVLVRVHAASINEYDVYDIMGGQGLSSPWTS